MHLAASTPSGFDRLKILVPGAQTISGVFEARTLLPFNDAAIALIEDLGRSLRLSTAARQYPELVALGYWARSANLKRLQQLFQAAYPRTIRLSRGLAFHVAPSNVDTIFVYSLLLSILAGNTNLVRISSRAGEQSGLLLSILEQAIERAAPSVRAGLAIVQYEHDQSVTDLLSARAAIRIVWGGNDTVQLIRRSPLSPAGRELVFPNKYSVAVLDASAWLALEDRAGTARQFVNDALWFGQMACSSPRAVIWRGTATDVEAASRSFWACVGTAADAASLPFEAHHAIAKLLAEQDLALIEPQALSLSTASNRIRVVRATDTTGLSATTNPGNGFFREYRVADLDAFLDLAQRDWQTVSSFGIGEPEWAEALQRANPGGIDRIVAVGSALDFNVIWDGTDLLTSMTRIVSTYL